MALNDTCYEDPQRRTFQQLLGKEAPVVLVEKDKGGMVDLVEAVDRKAMDDLLKKAGHKLKTAAAQRRDPSFDRERKRQALKRRGAEKAIALIVEAAEKKPLDEGFLASAILDLAWHDTAVDIAKRRDLEIGKGKRPEVVLEKLRKSLAAGELRGLLVEALVTRGAYFSSGMDQTDRLKDAAKLYGVDLAKCAKEAAAELKEKEDAKKAKEKSRSQKAWKKLEPLDDLVGTREEAIERHKKAAAK